MNYFHWSRLPIIFPDGRHANKANYQLFCNAQPTNVFVRWCGHPTALRPYYIEIAGHFAGDRAYRSALAAQGAAIAMAEQSRHLPKHTRAPLELAP